MRPALPALLLLVACGSSPPPFVPEETPTPCDVVGADPVLCRTDTVGTLTLGAPLAAGFVSGRHAGFALVLEANTTVDLALESAVPQLFLRAYGPSRALVAGAEAGALRVVAAEAGTWTIVAGNGGLLAGDFTIAATAYAPPVLELPPNMAWCPAGSDCAGATIDVRACPDTEPECTPRRSTSVAWTVNDAPVSALAVLLRPQDVGMSASATGNASMYWHFVMAQGAARMQLASDLPLKLSYYDVEPTWGGVTPLDYRATAHAESFGTSHFFHHATYDAGVSHDTLSAMLDEIAISLRGITGLTPLAYRAFLMPTELAVLLGGEGNWAFPDGTIAVNYGNPAWTEVQGGVDAVVEHVFAHEYTHQLFWQVQDRFQGHNTCLNEGLADALGHFAGFVPESDFGTAQDGSDFSLGCAASTEIHAKGNCVFWNAKEAGLFSREFMARLFAPEHAFDFDSCDLASERTGNAYVVYLTEAAGGVDQSAFVSGIGVPNAGSYAAALVSLGW